MEQENKINTQNFPGMLIKDIVTVNYKTAEVFGKYGIDFCCKGNRFLSAACAEKGIGTEAIEQELSALMESGITDSNNYTLWDLDYLAHYIINNHHRYVTNAVPVILGHLQKVVNAHGHKHDYLDTLHQQFELVSNDLLSHMQKEEVILFPAIVQLAESERSGDKATATGNFSIAAPINMMEKEHTDAGSVLEYMREITNNYTLPADACTTFAVTYKELQGFENDLHKHIFLENSILFPKAIKLESKLKQAN